MKIVWKIKGEYRKLISPYPPIPETNLDDGFFLSQSRKDAKKEGAKFFIH